jgi:luciferase family oxidoreductase group 1
LKLSILEQSTLSDNASASDAISNTIAVAIEADRLGYTRIWLSEHHNLNILQGSSPEILLAAIGAQTERIRIGSGGVMLPNHSPYHVAENLRVLEALYPGRIDCGIGRASGGDSFSRSLLSSNTGPGTNFDQRLVQLERHFHDECARAGYADGQDHSSHLAAFGWWSRQQRHTRRGKRTRSRARSLHQPLCNSRGCQTVPRSL